MPVNPDSIVVRVVQVDAPAGKPWDEPIDVTTDGFKTAAVFFVESGKDDVLAALWRDGADLRLRDENNTGSGVTLTDLLGGAGSSLLGKAVFKVDGGMIYNSDGDVLIKVNQ